MTNEASTYGLQTVLLIDEAENFVEAQLQSSTTLIEYGLVLRLDHCAAALNESARNELREECVSSEPRLVQPSKGDVFLPVDSD